MKQWYTLHCKPRKEAVVAKQLAYRNIEYYFPRVSNKQNNSAGSGSPFFAGYLFVFVDIQKKGFNTINYVPFTYGIVCYGIEPAPIPEIFIQRLRSTLSDSKLSSAQSVQVYIPGDKIKVTEGLFEGMDGIFKGCRSGSERALILLNIISNQFINIEMPMKHIQ